MQSADLTTAAAFQCAVTGSNANGSVTRVSANRVTSSPAPVPSPAAPAATSTLTAPDTVSVSAALPPGMRLVQGASTSVESTTEDRIGFTPPSGSTVFVAKIMAQGWTCNVETITCTRSSTVAAGESYPPIILHIGTSSEVADLAAPVVTVFGGGATPASKTVSDPTQIAPAVPFGVRIFTGEVQDEAHNPDTLAGDHPFVTTVDIRANGALTSGSAMAVAGGDLHEAQVDLPPGFSANPQNFPMCPAPIATSGSNSGVGDCPENTAVGYVEASTPGSGLTTEYDIGYNPQNTDRTLGRSSPLYNMVPDKGLPAELVFRVNGTPYVLEAGLRSSSDYGLTVGTKKIPNFVPINGARVTICAHGIQFQPDHSIRCAPTSPTAAPFINNPSRCDAEAPVTTLRGDSYENPGEYVEMGAYMGSPSAPFSSVGHPTKATPAANSYITGCGKLDGRFKPIISFQLETQEGERPTGASVDLEIPQTNEQGALMAPALKKALVTLPEGLTLNPSAANGLGACTEEEVGFIGTGFPAPNPTHFNQSPIECPDSSKVGTLEIDVPLLGEPLDGSIYLAAQKDNPFGSNYAIYLGIDDPKTGLVIKLPGLIEADSRTGRLTATFDYNPQLPLEHIRLHFFSGPQALPATPAICGIKTTTTEIVPWSAADSPTAAEIKTPSDSFNIGEGAAGAPCARLRLPCRSTSTSRLGPKTPRQTTGPFSTSPAPTAPRR